MRALMQDLTDFHAAMEQPIGGYPYLDIAPVDLIELRRSLIIEEVGELLNALRDRNTIEAADGMCDAIYVIVGTAVALGIDLAPLWPEVQRTNMAKTTGPVRHDGKRLKPEGWQPPDIAGLLAAQGGFPYQPDHRV